MEFLGSFFECYCKRSVDMNIKEYDAESILPKVLVRKINLYENVNFLLGMPHEKLMAEHGCEFPETIEVDSVEYTP
jgi:hypothetical protein